MAKITGVSTRTIRYYEELGILPTPERTAGGTRRYPREYVFYVEGAKTLRQFGFGLDEIAEIGAGCERLVKPFHVSQGPPSPHTLPANYSRMQ